MRFINDTAGGPVVAYLEVLNYEVTGDISGDSGDGTADCAQLGLAPLDFDLRKIWTTTFNTL